MRSYSLVALTIVALSSACAPATTYNRGIEMSFHPSAKADAQERLVSSAVELKTEGDMALVKESGGIYLGDLEVIGEKAGGMFMGKSGGNTLSGRVSLEAAGRGATHFFLSSSRVENGMESHYAGNGHSSTTPTSKTHARFVLLRVELGAWEKLPQKYRPEATPSAKATTAPGPSAAPGATGQQL